MKPRYFVIALALVLEAAPAGAFELRNPEQQKRLKIEIEPAPPVQQDFDKYVRELAAAARRDAESPPRNADKMKELQARAVNPVTLFHW